MVTRCLVCRIEMLYVVYDMMKIRQIYFSRRKIKYNMNKNKNVPEKYKKLKTHEKVKRHEKIHKKIHKKVQIKKKINKIKTKIKIHVKVQIQIKNINNETKTKKNKNKRRTGNLINN